MINNRPATWPFLALWLGLATATAAVAQTRECTYDRCALWLPQGVGSTMVVQGMEARPVHLDYLVRRRDLPAALADPIRQRYEASQKHRRRSAMLGGVSVVALLATLAYYYPEWDRGEWQPAPGVGLPLATVSFAHAAQVSGARSENHLRQALWLYNRTLPADSGVLTYDCPYDRCALRLQRRAWSQEIVQGADARRVGGLASAPVVELFAAAGDSARVHYEAFRTADVPVSRARRIGLAAALAGFILGAVSDAEGVAIGLAGLGYGILHMTLHSSRENRLEKAIWFYNRMLPVTASGDTILEQVPEAGGALR